MKPGLPQGVRDFLPDVVIKRNYIFDTIKSVAERFSFVPIETPSLENLSTLLGKYGAEGDKLIFKILNNGDFLKKADKHALQQGDSDALSSSISKRGLRYDLTVPFARYVVMNQNDLVFPFKRYQIQPVWRADRPQKNRYREFFQCDADVVGSTSLLYEAELIQMYDQVFAELKLPVVIRVNNRKILSAIAELVAPSIDAGIVISSIDKIDKIGVDRVVDNIKLKDTSADVVILNKYLAANTLQDLLALSAKNALLNQGISELQEVFNFLNNYKEINSIIWDPTLARGLDYYTGCIFEVVATHDTSVSIGGGGRYDSLTEIFGLKNMSGVGVSFGADRVYNMMEDLSLWPAASESESLVLIATDSTEALNRGFNLATDLRAQNVRISIYPEPAKWKKQFKYADQIQAKYVILIGEKELQEKVYTIKNMRTGDQNTHSLEEVIQILCG